MKKAIFLLAILGINLAFGAGEFDNVGGVVESFDKQVSTTSGTGLRIIMAWLPVVCLLTGLFLAIKHSKQQADQDKDNSKVVITCAIASIAGAILGVLIDAGIGAALLQDSMKGLKVLADYWLSALNI